MYSSSENDCKAGRPSATDVKNNHFGNTGEFRLHTFGMILHSMELPGKCPRGVGGLSNALSGRHQVGALRERRYQVSTCDRQDIRYLVRVLLLSFTCLSDRYFFGDAVSDEARDSPHLGRRPSSPHPRRTRMQKD
jgi:hypothetical protein